MKKIYQTLLLFFFILPLFLFTSAAQARVNPLSVSNNKFGVHVLFPSELGEAAQLVNSSGGDWGYVTIPIQAIDKNLVKWQKFMDDARRLHLIPIIRIATENYYFDTKVWRKPEETDVLDFANFLDSLDWPTKNRYVVIFNEVNRSDEWGNDLNPAEYAEILNYASGAFKSKSEDFFLISAGLDNASENVLGIAMNEYVFMEEMAKAVPGIFSEIDGIASHSYPNPGFRQPPSTLTNKSIGSFKYEKILADTLGNKNLPVFITETGWSQNMLSEFKIASYYEEAFRSVWNEENVVAVTPFLLDAREGDFVQFSLKNKDGSGNKAYKALKEIAKVKGMPSIGTTKAPSKPDDYLGRKFLPTKDFSEFSETNDNIALRVLQTYKTLLKWFIRI